MNVTRPVTRPIVTIGHPATTAAGEGQPVDEITYKGYRIEPESYSVKSTVWSPRVVVSQRTQEGWSRLTPLYSTDTARFPTRSEADRRALDVARAWIDTAIEQQRG